MWISKSEDLNPYALLTLDATGRRGVFLTRTELRHLGNLEAVVIDILEAGAKKWQ